MSGGLDFPPRFHSPRVTRITDSVTEDRQDPVMCIMCDEGATLDEVRFNIHGIIDRYGWFIQYVEAFPTSHAWAYTIGLTAGFDHPELVVTGVTPQAAARILNRLGEMIRSGRSFGVGGNHFVPSIGQLCFSEVHPAHYDRGVLATWIDYYDCLGMRPSATAIEVLLPGREAQLATSSSSFGH